MALGRLEDATVAVELLTTRDALRAGQLAARMEQLNQQRRLLTSQTTATAMEMLDKHPELLDYNALVLANPNDPLTPALVAWSHARTDCARALQVLQDHYPALFENPSGMSPIQVLAARVGVYCLQRSNQADQAGELLAAYRATIERIRVQQGPWIVAGDEHAAAHALAGEDDLAVQELTRLVDSGWRYYWWQLHNRVEYQHLATRADFIEMQQKLRAGVAKELAYFRQHRDQALF